MPLYEYLCDACGHRFETIRKFSDPPLESCPKCGGKVQKLVSSPAFQFKGSGWYATDYAKKPESGKSGASEKNEKNEKNEKSEKSDKSEKSEKSESSTSESKDKGGTDTKTTSSSDSGSKDSSASSTTKPS